MFKCSTITIKSAIIITMILLFVGAVGMANAANGTTPAQTQGLGSQVDAQLKAAAGQKGAGYGKAVDPRITVSLGIKVILSTLGVIFFVLTIYAGFLWMTAGGNEEQIEKSKKLLKRAVIGLIIILSAYSITWFAARIAFNYFDNPAGSIYVQPTYIQTP
ncbi:MAG: hypothetical protein ABH832_02405 [bacterium]